MYIAVRCVLNGPLWQPLHNSDPPMPTLCLATHQKSRVPHLEGRNKGKDLASLCRRPSKDTTDAWQCENLHCCITLMYSEPNQLSFRQAVEHQEEISRSGSCTSDLRPQICHKLVFAPSGQRKTYGFIPRLFLYCLSGSSKHFRILQKSYQLMLPLPLPHRELQLTDVSTL